MTSGVDETKLGMGNPGSPHQLQTDWNRDKICVWVKCFCKVAKVKNDSRVSPLLLSIYAEIFRYMNSAICYRGMQAV